jgi:hypothetical protein
MQGTFASHFTQAFSHKKIFLPQYKTLTFIISQQHSEAQE